MSSTSSILCSSTSFYGSPPESRSIRERRRLQRLKRLEQHVKSKVISTTGDKRLSVSYPEDYVVFRTQKDALAKAKELRLLTFAFETDASGARSFVVAHPDKMWTCLSNLKSHHRHIYEVIPQGSPSKLYFDIEYRKADNPGRSGDQGLRDFILFALAELKSLLNVDCSLRDVIDLDSSTDLKFSHHVIVETAVFENNNEVGAFVQHLCNSLSTELKDRISFADSDGRRKIFVDGAVYTKNRNFRTFLSSKFGKSATLKFSKSSFSTSESQTACDRDIFKRSLVTHLSGKSNPKYLNFSGRMPQASLSSNPGTDKSHPSSRSGQSSSPFREVDRFIESLFAGFSGGYIRKSSWRPEDLTLEYEIAGYRYCENVGRHHKSNNVKFVVLLNRNVYFQLCHDPDCADFKSRDYDLPFEVQPWLLSGDGQDQHEEEEDQELGNAEDNEFLMSAAASLEDSFDYESNIFDEF